MSEPPISWFHCGRCGSLFQSPAGEWEERTCGSCGRNPSLGTEPPATVPPSYTAATERVHPGRKRKRNYLMLKLVCGWLLVLAAILYGAHRMWKEPAEVEKPYVSQVAAEATVPDGDLALLQTVGPRCGETLTGFLAAGTPEERNQFVLSPITTAARMARFDSLNPIVPISPQTLVLSGSAVVHFPGRIAVETQWTTPDGHSLDAVFMEENGEWRLDWDHFARASDFPWALFLAGSGEDEGEFRLLARERLADERKNADTLSLVLYAPRFGFAGDTGFQSPEFIIPRSSRNGRLLDAAFKQVRSGENPFGVKLPSIDPEGQIRVRVKVRRFEQDLQRRFEIEAVVACHWYEADEPGVEIPE